MKTSVSRLLHSAFLVSGIGLLGIATADAVVVDRSFVQNGAGTCQAALPVFDGLVRKRPLAIQNEEGSTAFVSCSLVGTHFGPTNLRVMDLVFVGLINNTGSAVAVTCTLVDGIANSVSPAFITKIVAVAPGSSAELSWASADNGGNRFIMGANVQCALPFGAGVSYTGSLYKEEIGD